MNKRAAGVCIVVILAAIIFSYIWVRGSVLVQERGTKARWDISDNTVEADGRAQDAGDGDIVCAIGQPQDEGSASAPGQSGGNASVVGRPGEDYDPATGRPQEGSAPAPGQRQEYGLSLPREERQVLYAYAKYLGKCCAEGSADADWMRFGLLYIDSDDIPELAVIPSDSHCDGVCICVYDDGDVAEAGWFGSRGGFLYQPYTNFILSGFSNMGDSMSSLYRIEGGKSVELQYFHDWMESMYDPDSEYLYEVDGVRVSEEESHRAWEGWRLETLDFWGYDDAVPVRGTDDLYGELCRSYVSSREAVQDDSHLEEWKQAYLTWLEESTYADICTYSLVYVDEDDIPELWIDTGGEAGGCQILTFQDHALEEWQSNRLNVSYIERGNLVCNSDGNMGYYHDSVFSIRDGKWVCVGGGTHGDGPDGVQFDENGNIMEFYRWGTDWQNGFHDWWDGEEVDEEEYEARLNAIYPAEQSVYPQKYYILEEICSVLRTGDVASAEHRYELVVEDITWTEARERCQEKGGYLATITSQEEFERLQEQMISEGKENVTFFVGADNERENSSRVGYYWLEPGMENGYRMLGFYNALFRPFWLPGEPSYSGVTESGRKVREECVVLFYRKADGRCYLNDVPDDILEAAPSCEGRVGYICEYGR